MEIPSWPSAARETSVLWYAAGLCALLFLLFTAVVWGHDQAVRLDGVGRVTQSQRVLAALRSLDPPYPLDWSRLVLKSGSPIGVALLMGGLCGVAILFRDEIGILVALIGPFITGVIIELVAKPVVGRGAGNAFPSGHTGGVTAVGVVALFLLYRRFGKWVALIALPFVAILPAAMGFELVRNNVHYPTDVAGGFILAVGVVLAVIALFLADERSARRLQLTPGKSLPPGS